MTTSMFWLIALAAALGCALYQLMITVLGLTILYGVLAGRRLWDWYNHGWLYKDGRKAKFVPKRFFTKRWN